MGTVVNNVGAVAGGTGGVTPRDLIGAGANNVGVVAGGTGDVAPREVTGFDVACANMCG